MLKSMTKYGKNALGITRRRKCKAKLANRINLICIFKACPFFRLGALHKVNKGINI